MNVLAPRIKIPQLQLRQQLTATPRREQEMTPKKLLRVPNSARHERKGPQWSVTQRDSGNRWPFSLRKECVICIGTTFSRTGAGLAAAGNRPDRQKCARLAPLSQSPIVHKESPD